MTKLIEKIDSRGGEKEGYRWEVSLWTTNRTEVVVDMVVKLTVYRKRRYWFDKRIMTKTSSTSLKNAQDRMDIVEGKAENKVEKLIEQKQCH